MESRENILMEMDVMPTVYVFPKIFHIYSFRQGSQVRKVKGQKILLHYFIPSILTMIINFIFRKFFLNSMVQNLSVIVCEKPVPLNPLIKLNYNFGNFFLKLKILVVSKVYFKLLIVKIY